MILWISCKYTILENYLNRKMILRYGDDSSADDKDEEVKEPDHKKDSLQSLVENTRFSFTSLNH